MPKNAWIVVTFAVSCSAIRLRLNPLQQGTQKTESADTVPLGFENHIFQLQLDRSSFVQGELPDDAGAPKILFTHLLKAGGSSVINMLASLMYETPNNKYQYQSYKASLENSTDLVNMEDLKAEVPKGDVSQVHSNYFKIGMARNPCDYLLSMWNFQSKTNSPHGSGPRECLQSHYKGDVNELYRQGEGYLTSTDDLARFRKWVRASAGSWVHYLSFRSYMALHNDKKYHSTEIGKSFDDGQFLACMHELPDKKQKSIKDKLMEVDLSERYDCIIHTERLGDDSKACMVKYAQTIPDEGARKAFMDRVVAYGQGFNHKNLETPHGQCSSFFDGATAAFVWEREGVIAKKHGYDKCCGAATA